MKKLLTLLALLCVSTLGFSQAAYVKAVDSATISTSGKTFTHQNVIGELNIQVEYVLSGGPTITSIILQGCMRGNTCQTLNTYAASANAVIGITGLYDYYTVVPTWTGGASPSVTINWLSTSNSSPFGNTPSSLFNNSYALVTTAATVKSSGGNLLGWMITNGVATACWLQVFNAVSGSVTLGTTVPVLSIPLPLATGQATIQAPQTALILASFSTAMSVAATTTPNGSTTCGTGATVQLWFQ